MNDQQTKSRRCSLRVTQFEHEQPIQSAQVININNNSSIQFRRATIGNIPPPHYLASNNSNRQRKASGVSNIDFDLSKTIMRSRKNSQQIDPNKLHILRVQKYNKLYNNILNDLTKAQKHSSVQERSREKDEVKKAISRKIRMETEQSQFRKKFDFGSISRSKGRKVRSVKPQGIGSTSLEKESEKNKYFFEDHRKVVELQEECMLLEYYLKDREKQMEKEDMELLRRLSKTSQHRRITPNKKDSHTLYTAHSEQQYSTTKKRALRKEQFVEKCLAKARTNCSYRRKINFQQMQYVKQEHQKALQEQSTILGKDSGEVNSGVLTKELERNGRLMRLYLRYKWFPIDHPKADEAQTNRSYHQFKKQLFSLDDSIQFKEKQIDRKMEEIFRFKHQRCVHFQDFKQFILYINDLTGKDVLDIFEEKIPEHFVTAKDKIVQEKWKQIDKYFTANKVKFLLSEMFKVFPDKLMAGGQLLPIKVILSILKAFKISEKDYDVKELLRNYHWVQHHDAGITFDEFYKGSVLFKMKREKDWRGLQQFLKKVKYI